MFRTYYSFITLKMISARSCISYFLWLGFIKICYLISGFEFFISVYYSFAVFVLFINFQFLSHRYDENILVEKTGFFGFFWVGFGFGLGWGFENGFRSGLGRVGKKFFWVRVGLTFPTQCTTWTQWKNRGVTHAQLKLNEKSCTQKFWHGIYGKQSKYL